MKFHLLVVAASMQLAASGPQESVVFVLSDPTDPVKVMKAAVQTIADGQRAIRVEIFNATDRSLSTSDVWVDFSRFYTPTEMRRNGNVLFDCGIITAARAPGPLMPGAVVEATIRLPECRPHEGHEHFYLTVTRLSRQQRFGWDVWHREPADFTRLFKAARPHP
jgi:hypothetical protein